VQLLLSLKSRPNWSSSIPSSLYEIVSPSVFAVVGTRLAIKKGASYVRPLYLLVTTLLIGKQVYEILLK